MSTRSMSNSQQTTVPSRSGSSKLERYLMDTLFENSLFSDLSLVFIHPIYPIKMRFNVHKGIISQSPFLCKLLSNMERKQEEKSSSSTSNSSNSDIEEQPEQQQQQTTTMTTRNEHGVINSLTIDLSKALTQVGFVLAPFQHITRRKWQKTSTTDKKPTAESATTEQQRQQAHNTTRRQMRASHIRFALQWMYCFDKVEMIKSMKDTDTLLILSLAVLLDLHDLSQACVNRYTRHQLSLDSIMLDLETICQLPRGHGAYLQLRDASLLLLFRFGPEHATKLSQLPVDYMADVLSADILFVSCEFDRYCLLRAVLMSFMQSVGTIRWTKEGPRDQDAKRLSGFVKPLLALTTSATTKLTADTIKSRKRKRIPSQELLDPSTVTLQDKQKSRLSFTALVPFEKLIADKSSGGVIDKATVLSYLLRTTIHYSNMTFDQLTTVRQDGIVDEGIVFRALWQREALERVLFPYICHPRSLSQPQPQQQRTSSQMDRNAALDEYFDVNGSGDAQEKRKKILLGVPRFRFKASVTLSPPSVENGWQCEELQVGQYAQQEDLGDTFDDDSDGSLWSVTADKNVDQLQVGFNEGAASATSKGTPYKLYTKTFYSQAETILGISYRVQIEAQVMPRHRLLIQEENESMQEDDEVGKLFEQYRCNAEENILVCRFELQKDLKQIAAKEPFLPIKKEKTTASREKSTGIPIATSGSVPPKLSNITSSDSASSTAVVKPATSINTSQAAKSSASSSTVIASSSTSETVVIDRLASTVSNTSISATTTTASASTSTKTSNATAPKSSATTNPIAAKSSSTANVRAAAAKQTITIPTTAPNKQTQLKRPLTGTGIREKTKIHYWIYCLNRHDGIIENDRIDPEDRVLVAVTEQCERENGAPGEMEPGYIGQVLIDDAHYDLSKPITIDTTVALEIFGFQQSVLSGN